MLEEGENEWRDYGCGGVIFYFLSWSETVRAWRMLYEQNKSSIGQ